MTEAQRSSTYLSPEQKRALLAKLLQKRIDESFSEYPLSHGQRALWFLQQFAPGSTAYHVNFAARIGAGLDVAALRRAFQTLVDRHASLRTTFAIRDGKPVQRVHRHMKVHFIETDATGWSSAVLNERLVEEGHRRFDFEKGPLLRVYLFACGNGEHTLLINLHHVVFDAMSMVVLLDELRVLYPAEKSGVKPLLRPLPMQYTDYVRWQAGVVEGAEGERLWTYWQKQLAGELPPLNLAIARRRPPIQTYHGAAQNFRLERALTLRLKELAKSEKATLYVCLLAAFQVLLFRYSDQHDILVGSPMVSRHKAEFEGIVGYFINPVVLRADLSGNPTFQEFLGQVRQTVLAGLNHQDFPFPLLVERLQPPRDLSRSPLFQVLFNMPKAYRLEDQGLAQFILSNSGVRIDLGGIDLELFGIGQQTTMFDLMLTMVEAEQAVSASLQFNTDLFDGQAMARVVEHFQTLVAGIAQDPTRQISQFPLLTESERQEQAAFASGNRSELPENAFAYRSFEAQVEKTPQAAAVRFRGLEWTYQELNRRANRLAGVLVKRNIGPNAPTALLAHRGVDFLTAILAVWKAGGAYLPLDPYQPPHRISQVLQGSATPLVVAEESLLSLFPKIPAVGRPTVLVLEELLQAEEDEENLSLQTSPRDLSYVIYTSGSTGVPKGAMIEHVGMFNHLHAKISQLELTCADTVAQTASQCFDISVWQFSAVLLLGGCVQIIESEVANDPLRLLDEIEKGRISILEIVPSMLQALIGEAARRKPNRLGLGALRWVISTGEALPPTLCRQWLELYPGTRMLNAYGPTECSDDVTHYVIDRVPDESATHIPIGCPINNARVYVLDRHMQPVPVGIPGELCVGGIPVGRGYLNDPEHTAQAFVPDPFSETPGARLYKSGDVARYRADGNIEFLGRQDHQLKIRGNRLEAEEIETVLRQHPALGETVVLPSPNPEGEMRLVCYATVSQGSSPTASKLRHFLRDRLPDYMVPSLFVLLEKMPLLANGKLDRNALPAPDWSRRELDQNFVAPRTPLEEKLASIWSRVLGLEKVGVYDNFFELGGHSLSAVQLVSEVCEACGTSILLATFLETPTIADMAQLIATGGSANLRGPIPPMTAKQLAAEAVLDPSIRADSLPCPAGTESTRPFLTGATGFLGAYLLQTLLQSGDSTVYCLVRSQQADAKTRIREILASYSLWDDSFSSRIVPIVGDLSQPCLGLSPSAFEQLAREVDAIYHNGALVNFLYPYGALKPANVSGTHEVLRLACHATVKPVHHISTVSVFAGLATRDQEVTEDTELNFIDQLFDGYSQSKWVGERLVTIAASRGLPIRIYRPHWVTGHSQSGICSTDDLVFQLIRSCILLGCVPDLDILVDMAPVDYVSRAIVHLSRQTETAARVFHLVNPQPARLHEVVEWIRSFGYPLRSIPYDTWIAELMKSALGPAGDHLHILASLLRNRMVQEDLPSGATLSLARMGRIRARNTEAALGDTTCVCPPVSAKMLATYMNYMNQVGFLPQPGRTIDYGAD